MRVLLFFRWTQDSEPSPVASCRPLAKGAVNNGASAKSIGMGTLLLLLLLEEGWDEGALILPLDSILVKPGLSPCGSNPKMSPVSAK